MKKLGLIVLMALFSLSAFSQDKLYKIDQMRVYEYNEVKKDYEIVQDWVQYDAQILFKGNMMYLGASVDKITNLKTWATYTQAIAPMSSATDNFKRETSGWIFNGDSTKECVVDLKFFRDGSILLDHMLGGYIFSYSVTKQ